MPSDVLPDDLETLKAMLLAERMQNERLRQIIKEMQRHRFGRRAETLPEDQMLLGLEDVARWPLKGSAESAGNLPSKILARFSKRSLVVPLRSAKAALLVLWVRWIACSDVPLQ
jgi:hypothetical protein